MIILKSLLSGGNTTRLTENNSGKHNTGEGGGGGNRSEDIVKEANYRTTDKVRKMEFMYCIPDLEVFIDKTIKKCLLEYDLDANDTEAVLDDMEKAWPKSPLRSPEKQDLKDFNDNTQKGINNKQISVANQFQEEVPLDNGSDKNTLIMYNTVPVSDKLKDTESQELSERLYLKKSESTNVATIVKKEIEHTVVEGYRSDNSSPDVIDGQSHARKHPKLKSLLQKRYFAGQESSVGNTDQPGYKSNGKVDETWDANKSMSSNLDLLASAADIHTVSARGTQEHRVQAIRRLQEESERQFQVNAAKRFQNNSLDKSVSSGRMPVLLKLMSSSSSSPVPEFNNHHNEIAGGQQNSRLITTSPETSQRVSPSTSFHESSHEKVFSRMEDKNATSFLSRERAQQLYQSHQNGYRPMLPQETVVHRIDLSSASNDVSSELGRKQTTGAATHSNPSWSNDIDRSTTTTRNHNTPNSRYQPHDHNHLDRYPNYSDNYIEPYHYHGSRIANIIAEELQKDDDCGHEKRNQISFVRTIPSDFLPSNTLESARSRSFSLPGTYKRTTSKESASSVSQILQLCNSGDRYYNRKEPVVNVYSRAMPKLLPAHLIMTNTHSGSANLASHLVHTTSASSNSVIRNISSRDDEEQPQDLSTKSRRLVEDEVDGQNFSSSITRASERETRTSSPSSVDVRVRHVESPSPCSYSDRECDYNSRSETGSTTIKTFEVERKGQVHGVDINPTGVKDNHILATKRNHRTIMSCSETGDSEIAKRRKLE